MRLGSLCAVTAVLLCASNLLAQTTIHVPTDQPTIQAGINAAVNGDTVLVAPGTYYENIDFKGKAITVTSFTNTPFPLSTPGAPLPNNVANTIIDGSKNASPVVTFQSGEVRTSVLEGFTIQNGGSGGYFEQKGGGVYTTNSAPQISFNHFTNNYCQGVYAYVASPLISENVIDNTLDTPGDCTFAGGSAIWVDGGLSSSHTSSTPLVPTILYNTLENNTQSGTEDAGGNGGAGVSLWGGNTVIAGNIIRNNLSHGQGGGIHLENGASAIIYQNLIYGNEAGGGGGGLATNGYVGAVNTFIANNTFVNNTYGGGGGESDDEAVGQIYLGYFAYSGPSISFVNNIVAGNTTDPAVVCGSPSYGHSGANDIIFDHNLFYNSGGATFEFCLDPTGTYGNLTANPMFASAPVTTSSGAIFPYTLAANSPAIDTGNNSAAAFLSVNSITTSFGTSGDLAGNYRWEDVTGKGYPIIDIGAYEFQATVNHDETFIALTPSVYSTAAGNPLTLTANTFSTNGTPTGPLTFVEDGTSIGTVNLDASGNATQTVSLTPGIHRFIATYPGQGVFPPSISIESIVVVSNYSPSLSLTSTPNPSLLNTSVTFTITITSPDGAVLSPITLTNQTTNTVLATLTPNSSGIATFTTSTLPLGNNAINASYPGDSEHNSASTTLFQDVVNGFASTTTVTSSLNPSNVGQSVTFSAKVTSPTGTPTGSIQFSSSISGALATVPLNTAGLATYTTSALLAGSQTITATYVPTGSYATSTGSLTQVVNGLPTVTTVSLTPNPSTYGQPQIFTVHVAPVTPTSSVPSGIVVITFCRGATIRFTLDATGSASIIQPTGTEIAEPVSTCIFTANYQGDTIFAPSTSAQGNDIVTPAPSTTTITAQPNPGYALAPITVSVTVVGNPSPTANPVTGNPIPPGITVPSGTVTLTDGTTTLGSATIANGKATFTLTTLALGTHTLTATYAADPNLAVSSASTAVNVLANTTATTLVATPNPGVQGQTITLAPTVTDTSSSAPPAGIVQIYDGGTLIQTVSLPATSSGFGSATLIQAYDTFTPGIHILTAVYVPSSTAFLPSTSAPVSLTIAAQDFTFTATQPTITIQTAHHAPLPLTLTSIGGFSGPITIACTGTLPPYLTCELLSSTALAANATTNVSLTLETDQVADFYARNRPPAANSRLLITLATLLPLALVGLRKRRVLHRVTLALLTLTLAASTLAACTGYYPHSTPPGTYIIPLAATGTTTGIATPITHTLNITLTVTP